MTKLNVPTPTRTSDIMPSDTTPIDAALKSYRKYLDLIIPNDTWVWVMPTDAPSDTRPDTTDDADDADTGGAMRREDEQSDTTADAL